MVSLRPGVEEFCELAQGMLVDMWTLQPQTGYHLCTTTGSGLRTQRKIGPNSAPRNQQSTLVSGGRLGMYVPSLPTWFLGHSLPPCGFLVMSP